MSRYSGGYSESDVWVLRGLAKLFCRRRRCGYIFSAVAINEPAQVSTVPIKTDISSKAYQ